MWKVVALVIFKKQVNNDTVKHRYDGHKNSSYFPQIYAKNPALPRDFSLFVLDDEGHGFVAPVLPQLQLYGAVMKICYS
jgi:hypothetical protein